MKEGKTKKYMNWGTKYDLCWWHRYEREISEYSIRQAFDLQWSHIEDDDADVLAMLLQNYREKGVFHFTFNVPEETSQVTLVATYRDSEGDTAVTKAQANAFFSPQV